MLPAALNVCQELQSCLQPMLVEQHGNKLFETRSRKAGGPPGGWNLLDCLARNMAQVTEDLEQVYLHPLSRRSMYSLSEKSLEMCTENLGSETGCVIYSSIDEFTSRITDKQSFLETKYSKTREFPKKMGHGICFPPPLSSISGRDGVRMHSHREGGRLVIKAFSFSSCGAYFRAIRKDGRLRLCFQMNESKDWDTEVTGNREREEEENGYETKKSCHQRDDGEWCSRSRGRCDGGGKRLASLPCYVAIS